MQETVHISKPQEHLNLKLEGARPIVSCIGTLKDFEKQEVYVGKRLEKGNIVRLDNKQNVDWHADARDLTAAQQLNAGSHTYVFSTIDGSNKFSEGFIRCTGLVVCGIDRETGKNVSFITHQDPHQFLESKKEMFLQHLKQSLEVIKDRCVPNTVDAVVVGGSYYKDFYDKFAYKTYIDSIRLLGQEVKKVLGFEPEVVNGPSKGKLGFDDVYYDNDHRRVYLLRTWVNTDVGSFPPSDLESHEPKWHK